MSEQQKKDHEFVIDFWKLLKEFGNLTNDPQDQSRWHEFVERSNEIRKKYPEERRLFIDLDIMLNNRALAANGGELKIAC